MTEEQQVRDLLTRAAEMSGPVSAPVGQLIAAGRRRRVRYRLATGVVAALAVALAAAVPALVRGGSEAGPAAAPRQPAPGSVAALERARWTRWEPIACFSASCDFAAAWTGRELVVASFGGLSSPGRLTVAAYVPGAGWRSVAGAPDWAGVASAQQDIFFAGQYLVVLHSLSYQPPGGAVQAAVFDPASGSWSVSRYPLPVFSESDGQSFAFAAGSIGSQVVVAAVVSGRPVAYSYSVTARSWRPMALSLPAGHQVSALTMADADGRLVLWSTWDDGIRGAQRPGRSGVDVRAMTAARRWYPVSGWPQALQYFSLGTQANGQLLLTLTQPPGLAYLVDAATLAVRPVWTWPFAGAQSPRYAAALWTGRVVIALAAVRYCPSCSQVPQFGPDLMAALDPATGQGHRLPGTTPTVGLRWTVLWGGSQMFVTNGSVVWAFGS